MVSHIGEKRKEMILVSHHHVWMSKKENHVRWGYGRDFFFFICILKGNLGIVNNTQPIIFVSSHFSQIWLSLVRNKIGLVSDFSFSPFLIYFVIQTKERIWFLSISYQNFHTRRVVNEEVLKLYPVISAFAWFEMNQKEENIIKSYNE